MQTSKSGHGLADGLLGLAGWLADSLEHSPTFELSDLIRAHGIIAFVGRSAPLFDRAERMLNRMALRLLENNDHRWLAAQRRRPAALDAALATRARIRRRTLRLLAWLVDEAAGELAMTYDAQSRTAQVARLVRLDADRVLQKLRQQAAAFDRR